MRDELEVVLQGIGSINKSLHTIYAISCLEILIKKHPALVDASVTPLRLGPRKPKIPNLKPYLEGQGDL